MKTNQLIEAYIGRSDAHAAQLETCETPEKLTPPSFVREVIIPLIIALAEDMPEHNVIIPNPAHYSMKGEHYRIKVGLSTIGGISVWEGDEIILHYIRMSRAKTVGERVPITDTKELAQIIRKQLTTGK